MKNKELVSINKMIEYIDKAITYTNGYSYDDFCRDDKTINATIFVVSQIGELVKNIEAGTRNKYPEIEWKAIHGIRNRIVHDYEGIKLKLIWHIVINDIPKLKADLTMILHGEE